jgi:GWxTD domain-containing protein
MKRTVLTLAFSCIIFSLLQAQSLSANFDYARFQIDEKSPYLETYLSFNASTCKLRQAKNGEWTASIEVIMQLKSQGEVKHYDRYIVNSPAMADSSQNTFDFINIQRIALPVGDYEFDLSIQDINTKEAAIKHQQMIKLQTEEDCSFSDITLLENYQENNSKGKLNKGGFELKPLVRNTYLDQQTELSFYTEAYNTPAQYVLRYYIADANTNEVVHQLAKTSVIKTAGNKPVLASLPIKQLPSGSYKLICEVRDTENMPLATQEKFFYRINNSLAIASAEETSIQGTFVDGMILDQLKVYIAYLYPIQSTSESRHLSTQLELNDLELMKKYFYHFWKTRNPLNPEKAWNTYLAQVAAVNKEFSEGKVRGYLTDRGRVYLQYGSPNSITKEYFQHDQTPFEVWHYHHINQQTDCRFLFTHDMSNSMELVISNVDGELINNEWIMRYERDNPNKYFDSNSPLDIFNNPR